MRQGYQPIIEASWNEKRLINFRIIAQKQIPPLEWGDPVGPGVRWAPKNKVLLCKPTPRSNFCLLVPAKLFKLIPYSVGRPCRPGVRWAPQNKVLLCKPTPRSNFCLLVTVKLFKLIPPFDGVDPAGPLVGVSPPQIEIYQANPPRGATFACWPPPYSHCKHPHLVEWTLWAWG